MYWNDAVDVAIKLGLGWIVTLDVLKLVTSTSTSVSYRSWIVTLDVLKWYCWIKDSLSVFVE